MKLASLRWLIVLLVLIFSAAPLWSQGFQRTIRGDVRDPSGTLVPGVTLLIKATTTGETRSNTIRAGYQSTNSRIADIELADLLTSSPQKLRRSHEKESSLAIHFRSRNAWLDAVVAARRIIRRSHAVPALEGMMDYSVTGLGGTRGTGTLDPITVEYLVEKQIKLEVAAAADIVAAFLHWQTFEKTNVPSSAMGVGLPHRWWADRNLFSRVSSSASNFLQ